MAVPDRQSFMLPLLKIAGDGNEHSNLEVYETLAQQFGLNETDRKENHWEKPFECYLDNVPEFNPRGIFYWKGRNNLSLPRFAFPLNASWTDE